jgi:hypothetical protein
MVSTPAEKTVEYLLTYLQACGMGNLSKVEFVLMII